MARPPHTSSYALIPMDNALSLLERACEDALAAGGGLRAALQRPRVGEVLAERVVAPHDVPARPLSRLDGYAVRAAAVVVGERVQRSAGAMRAGDGAVAVENNGSAPVYVTTGGALPRGADAVVKIEDAVVDDDGGVTFSAAPPVGEGVRAVGSDIARGEELFSAGHELTAADVGGLALARVRDVSCAARPRVGILSSGNELVDAVTAAAASAADADAATAEEPVWDANAPVLAALASEFGGAPWECGVVRDDRAATLLAIARAAWKSDVLVSTGAVSMGDADHVKPALEALARGVRARIGADDEIEGIERDGAGNDGDGAAARHLVSISGRVAFGRLLMKPGKPATLALLRFSSGDAGAGAPVQTCVVLALPGNPVSAWVCAHVLLAPAIRRLRGVPWALSHAPKAEVFLEADAVLDAERPEFHRACVFDVPGRGLCARSTGSQASSRLASTAHANALLWLPAATQETRVLRAGTRITAQLIGPLRAQPPPLPPPVDAARRDGGGCACSGARVSRAGGTQGAPIPREPHNTTETRPDTRAGVLTVSDSCFAGTATDESGPAAAALLSGALFAPPASGAAQRAPRIEVRVVPDDVDAIRAALLEWAPRMDLIVTTGGTGFGPRDVTPEATAPLLARRAPGLVAAMLGAGLARTPLAALSRPEAGVMLTGVGAATLVVNLPGSVKAVRECLQPLLAVLPHAIKLMDNTLPVRADD